ncbi:MAG: hypothetical protein H6828_05320 [Planctomycetes bacterium]|nr:hypothetical protein [Planctomycetota bacterium]
MPILELCVVGELAPERRVGLAARVADAAGALCGAAPGHTWVRLAWLAREHYAESGGGPPGDVQPVFASLLLADPPDEDERVRLAAALSDALARACGRPAEHVHLVFEPAARGRVAFGGRLVR